MSKFTLNAFADEISSELDEPIRRIKQLDIHYPDLRGVNGINVKDLADREVTRIREYFRIKGIQVGCIGRPIGEITLIGTQSALQILPGQLLFSPFAQDVVSFLEIADPFPVVVAKPDEITLEQDSGDHAAVHINFRDTIRGEESLIYPGDEGI